MNNATDIKYLSRLIEPQIQNTCRYAENDLRCHLQLPPETAHQVVMQALHNIIGRETRWQQLEQQAGQRQPVYPEEQPRQQVMHLYTDSDLTMPVMDIPVE